MDDKNTPWWAHVVLATMIAAGFSAVPFWIIGLPLKFAEVAATIIFPLVIVAYVLIMKSKFK